MSILLVRSIQNILIKIWREIIDDCYNNNGFNELINKKAKQSFEKNGIPFVSRMSLVKEPLTIGELHNILRMTIEETTK